MSSWFLTPEEWLVRSSIAGGVLLLAGVLLMWLTPQPARRQRLGELALGCSLLVAALSALPAWTPWTIPLWSEPFIAGPAAVPMEEITLVTTERDTLVASRTPDQRFTYAVRTDADFVAEPPPTLDAPETVRAPERPALHQGKIWQATLSCLVTAYVMMMLALLIRCLLGQVGLRRMWSSSTPPPPHVAGLFARLTQGWRLRPRLGVSPRVPLPVSFGLWRPTVLIPASFCHPSKAEDLRQVLVHELTHLERFDSWSCLLLALGQSVYFYLPWLWWLRKQVRLCQEYVADAAAAALTSSEDYAEYLVSLTEYTAPRLPVGARVMGVKGSDSDLFRRVTMLLNASRAVENRPPRWWSAVTAGAFLAVAVVLSGIGLRAPAHADDGKSGPAKDEFRILADTADQKIILVRPDPADEKKFIVVSPSEGDLKWVKEVRPFLGAGEDKVFVWAAPAGEVKYFVGAQAARAEPKSEKRVVTVVAGEGGEKKVTVLGPDGKVIGKNVQVIESEDGKRIIIILDADGEKKPADKKEGAKKEPIKQVIQRKYEIVKSEADKAKQQTDEAIKKALEQLKKYQSEDADAVRKALEEAVKKAQPPKALLEKQVIEDVRKALEKHAPKEDLEQLHRAMELYKKALEEKASPMRLKQLQDETRSKVDAERARAEEALKQARGEAEEKLKAARAAQAEAGQKAKAALAEAAKAADEKAKAAAKAAESEVARAKEYVARLKPSGGKLGVAIAAPSEALIAQLDLPKGRGLVIEAVAADSPAAKAGFQAHDILVEFNGKPVSSDPEAFAKAVGELKAGTKVDAVVLRKGKRTAVKGLVLAEASAEPAKFEFKLEPRHKIELREVQDFFKKAEPGKKFELEKSKDFFKKSDKIELELKDLKLDELKKLDLDVRSWPKDRIELKVGPGGKLEVKPLELLKDGQKLHELQVVTPGQPLRKLIKSETGAERKISLTVTRDNDKFTAKHDEENLVITVTGKVKDGKAAVEAIKVEADGSEKKYESLDKAPERVQSRVKKMIELVEKGKVEFKVDD
jgi:beta-lactamase regulating signal transducer with metallopeptidase domain/membrane-associated protease RseP (regulator of RpoE activity)